MSCSLSDVRVAYVFLFFRKTGAYIRPNGSSSRDTMLTRRAAAGVLVAVMVGVLAAGLARAGTWGTVHVDHNTIPPGTQCISLRYLSYVDGEYQADGTTTFQWRINTGTWYDITNVYETTTRHYNFDFTVTVNVYSGDNLYIVAHDSSGDATWTCWK